ncbi:bifunctional hydroxymethylpyrimidine kinase/phosphomethylpyrimidine kinase (plasmid) [Deinococcus radiomollis]|uniref:bifunctional hydroxymethylpyrimidine kinase/phosphomethylpyrimidine kinase n=1 Tax=Deinococcus radiomollis TaxID=468916 RepID=UPI003891EEE4
MKAVALTIAGSDSGGGAGIQADLKTFAAHGVYGTSALTVVTAQNTRGIRMAVALDPALVLAQIEAVLDDFPVAAVKTGALSNTGVIEVVARALEGRNLPLIVDPVMFAKSGDALLDEDALESMKALLFPLATLVTPNLPEAERLLDLHAGHLSAPEAIQALVRSLSPFPMLLKGGHGTEEQLHDHLLLPDLTQEFTSVRQFTRHTHGTGCTLSAAITANLALGLALPLAVERARDYVQAAIYVAPGLGSGAGPLEHFPFRAGSMG